MLLLFNKGFIVRQKLYILYILLHYLFRCYLYYFEKVFPSVVNLLLWQFVCLTLDMKHREIAGMQLPAL